MKWIDILIDKLGSKFQNLVQQISARNGSQFAKGWGEIPKLFSQTNSMEFAIFGSRPEHQFESVTEILAPLSSQS